MPSVPQRSCHLSFLEAISAVQSQVMDILLSRSTPNQAALGLPSSVVVLEDVIKLFVQEPDCSCNRAAADTRPFQQGTRRAAIQSHLLNTERALLARVPPTGSGRNETGGSLTSWRRRGLEKEKPSGKDPERGGRPQREARPRPRRCAPRERAGPARAQPGA